MEAAAGTSLGYAIQTRGVCGFNRDTKTAGSASSNFPLLIDSPLTPFRKLTFVECWNREMIDRAIRAELLNSTNRSKIGKRHPVRRTGCKRGGQ